MNHCSGKNGYSLMELIAVISIISIMAAVVLPSADDFFSGQRVQAVAGDFVQDLRAARYSAMSTQVYQRIVLQTDGYYVQSYKTQSSVPAADVTAAVTNANWNNALEVEKREFDPVVTVELPSGLSYIFVRPDGLFVDYPTENGSPIGDYIATFTYGDSTLLVNVNANGVAAAEEYYEN